MSTLSSANVTDVNLVLKECTHMRLCINMLIFTHNLGNWLMLVSSVGVYWAVVLFVGECRQSEQTGEDSRV